MLDDSELLDSGSDEDSEGEDAPLPGELDDDSDGSDEDEHEDDAPLPGELDEEEDSDEEEGAAAVEDEDEGSSDEEPLESGEGDEDAGPRGRQGEPSTSGDPARRGTFFAETPEGTSFAANSFGELNLSRPLVKACAALGYASPTPIQAACIPLALTGRDICGSAMTGSGKTAAFSLPVLERLLYRNKRVPAIYVLVLTPTRELAVQVQSMITKLAQFTDIRTALVVGGLSLKQQESTLRTRPEVVVGTPGRLIDLVRNTQSVGLEELAALVLDEADRLLEMGFMEEIREIVRLCPRKRQTMLFSATMTEEVKKLAAVSLKDPVRLAADEIGAAPKGLVQEIVRLKGADAVAKKEAILMSMCARTLAEGRTIVFFRTKQRAHRMKILFGLAGLPPTAELHGDMSQTMRLESLEKFRKGEVKFLLSTDVAARGLDILGVQTIVNFDAPRQFANYLHRIGRTARAGRDGRAVTFIEDGDKMLLKAVAKKQKNATIRNRVLPAGDVDAWLAKIEALDSEVRQVYDEEAQERFIRKAEMEAQKASNMIEHEQEIYARPARTWFQTEKEKKDLKQRRKEENDDVPEDEEEEGDGPSTSKSRAMRQKEKEDLKRQRAKELEEANKPGKKRPLTDDQKEMAAAKRSAKRLKAVERDLREQGLDRATIRKISAKVMDPEGTKKAALKRKKALKGSFEGDGHKKRGVEADAAAAAGTAKVYAGGAKSGKVKEAKKPVSDLEKKRLARKGKGIKSFKSKARYKRR